MLCAYAALIEPDIAGVVAIDPLPTHADSRAPQLLSVLRVCDVPDVFGMLAPKPLSIRAGSVHSEQTATREIIAERVIAVLVELAGGVELSEEEFAALEARLVQEDRLPSDEEVEAMFKTLLR